MLSTVIRANIEVHTRMAASYDRLEPHFRPENRGKVRRVLEGLARRCGRERLLDLGCGTGFIVTLACDLFREVHGLDVTQAMLDRVDTSSGNITLHCQNAEELPFENDTFNLVTAYSFLHHLEDYRPVLAEAYRVLKPGGIFYVDLEPNRLFWSEMAGVSARADLPPMVAKACDSVLRTDAKVEEGFGIPRATFQQAEYGKSILGGIDASQAAEAARETGFQSVAVSYEWFLGQAEVMHGKSFEEAAKVESYLRAIAPLSDRLFKYVQLQFMK